ncbi:phosphopantothenate--cysteine ligase [Enterococcus faecalis]
MELLITAGGTSEPIDQVRSITNHSSGGLGKMIADQFLQANHTVTYVTTKQALRPQPHKRLSIKEIETTADLAQQLTTLFQEKQFDSIIHCMAVSDFTSETAITEADFIQELAQNLATTVDTQTPTDIAAAIKNTLNDIGTRPQKEQKISSSTERLLLFLKKNPKIIAMIRQQQPETILVGFKLLVNVPKAELLNVAMTTLVQNQCDFVFANDLHYVHAIDHQGYLLHKDGTVTPAQTKQAIAETIWRNVEQVWRSKK